MPRTEPLTPRVADGDVRVRGHLPVLDGVRGLAILMVLVLHFIGDMEPQTTLEQVVSFVTGKGAYGVDLFFVLSGFLITGILADARGSRGYFRNFYMRRILRIFPLYYAVCAVALSAAAFVPALATLHDKRGWLLLYGTNVYDALHGAMSFAYLDHFWSLAVEEHFYFVWPLVVWALPRSALLWVAGGASLAAAAAAVLGTVAGVNATALYVLTPFRLGGLCLGGFIAILARSPDGIATLRKSLRPVALWTSAFIAGSLAFKALVLPQGSPALHALRDVGWTVLLACVLVAALLAPAGSPVARAAGAGWLRFLGKYSYGLYVFHHLVSWPLLSEHSGHVLEHALARIIGSHFAAVLLQAAAGVAVSLLISMLSYRFFEEPILRLKRFFPSASAAPAAVTAQAQ